METSEHLEELDELDRLAFTGAPVAKILNFDNFSVYRISFDYNPDLVEMVKEIPGRKYHPEIKIWSAPANPVSQTMLEEAGFTVEPVKIEKQEHFLDLSGLRLELRPYQFEGVQKIASDFNLRALLADDMGLGKTIQTLAAIWARRSETLPALVICPASMKLAWQQEALTWLGMESEILDGMPKDVTAFRPDMPLTIVNYDVIAKHGKTSGWGKILEKSGFRTLILDESQKIKDKDTARTKAIIRLARKAEYRIALTGTPLVSRPIELWSQLKAVNPYVLPDYHSFGKRYCDPEITAYGVTYKGATNSEELHKLLTTSVMIRRKKEEVLKELPQKQRMIMPAKITMAGYKKAEKELLAFTKNARKVSASFLGMVEKAKQAAVTAKLENALEWIETYLESGRKLVVFATHIAVMNALQKHWPSCARVDGKVTGKKRQAEVERFQNDESCRLFIGNLQAAGLGLTLTAASDTLTLELGWTPGEHLQAEDRVHRLGQTADSVTAYYMVASETIEEDIMEMIDKKTQMIAQVTDGMAEGSNESLAQQLFQSLKARIKTAK